MFRPMTRTNEISAFIGKALKADDDIKQRVIWALSQLDESDWATINKMIDLIAGKKEKGPDYSGALGRLITAAVSNSKCLQFVRHLNHLDDR